MDFGQGLELHASQVFLGVWLRRNGWGDGVQLSLFSLWLTRIGTMERDACGRAARTACNRCKQWRMQEWWKSDERRKKQMEMGRWVMMAGFGGRGGVGVCGAVYIGCERT